MRAFASSRIVTCDPARASKDNPLGAIDDAAIVVEGSRITWIGPRAHAPAPVEEALGVITPGLVDAHTHSAWAGSRHGEYAVRMAGGDYRAIAAAGGGIVSTQRAIAQTSLANLETILCERLLRMSKLGVTTIEVKSGYGLVPEEERKQLTAIAAASKRANLPRVVATYLALHAIPQGVDRSSYVRTQIERVTEYKSLATFVDAYVDPHAFTVDEARALGGAANDAGLGIRMHVGQFGDIGGAELAADLGAKSVDHVEHVSDRGIEALARAGTAAVLLPVASYTLGQAPPPVAKLRSAVDLVVASDANPGTAPTESLPLAMALAVRSYGLSPDEAILCATRNAARTLSCSATGMLRVGDPADIVVWDLPHEHAIVQPWGVPKARIVMKDGNVL